MKVITFEDIMALDISPVTCYEWVENTIRYKKEMMLPPKVSMKTVEGAFINVMPSIIYKEDCCMGGTKIVTRYPHRVPSLDSSIMLYDALSGSALALMDANWITAMRTGAVAVHSILRLAKSGFSTIGIIGLGNTARATVQVLAEKMPNKVFQIKLLKYKNQAELFMDRFSKYSNLQFTVMDELEEIVKISDVVVSCVTYFENDICKDECFQEGVLVIPVHTRGFTNCDLFFDKVFADDTAHVINFKNFSKFKFFAEMSDVVNNRSIGRENDRERILVYNIGISIHDIYYAANIYQIYAQNMEIFNKLLDIDMKGPLTKFWV